MRPEEALEAARAAVERARREGRLREPADGLTIEPAPVTRERLLAWALIEPDLRDVRSTRRFGRPITLVKRGLVRALRQYHAEVLAQQTRFNVHAVAYLTELEDRIERLERERGS